MGQLLTSGVPSRAAVERTEVTSAVEPADVCGGQGPSCRCGDHISNDHRLAECSAGDLLSQNRHCRAAQKGWPLMSLWAFSLLVSEPLSLVAGVYGMT